MFTEAFVQLCREAKLERKFKSGDWVESYGYQIIPICDTPGPEEWVWLPRLDQLLELLTEEGWLYLRLCRSLELYRIERGADNTGDPDLYDLMFECGSWEEAALRLLLAVRAKVPL